MKKVFAYRLIVVFLLILALSGCGPRGGGRKGGGTTPTTPSPKVYIGGYYHNYDHSTTGVNTACYWDADGRHDLGDGSSDSEVVWLSFYNNELYAIGSYYDRTAGKTVPCYWKNNTKENLDDINSVPGYVNVHCGFVYNDQVYAGGSYLVGSQRIPCYWDQNGRHDLAIPEGESAEVTTLFVNSDGVYAGGFLYPWTACYWDEKGELHQLNGKDVKEMKIVNGCIYLGGANESGACYWVIDGGTGEDSAA